MNAIQEELEQALRKGVEDGKIPHAIVYATNADGSFEYSFATGFQHYGVDEEPIQKDAVLMLASQTKLLTAIAAMQAVEQGIVHLDEDVTPDLPEFDRHGILTGFDDDDQPILEQRKNPVTIRHLLTHTSGKDYMMAPDIVKHQKQRGLGRAKQAYAGTVLERYDTALLFEPGESWMYSPGLDWFGVLLHRRTGLTLEAWFQKNICAPLGLAGITFRPKENPLLRDKIPQLAGRTPEGALTPFTGDTINTHTTECFGGHGAYAQLGDYIKVLRSLLANDGKLLRPASVEQLFAPQLGADAQAALDRFCAAFGSMLPGELNAEVPMQYGLGGAVFMADDVGRRSRGTMQWAGMTNPFWIIDRTAGLTLTFGTQVLPPGDPGCKEMTGIVERAIYKMAGAEVGLKGRNT